MGNGVNGLRANQTSQKVQQSPPTQAVKSSDPCEAGILGPLKDAAKDNGGSLPLYSLTGPSVNSVIKNYNADESHGNTFTGSAYDVAHDNRESLPWYISPVIDYAAGAINPQATYKQLLRSDAECAVKQSIGQ